MNMKLHFFGAAQNVTGSRYLLDTGKFKVLVDSGLHQEREFKARDWDPFPVKPAEIDAVVLTHAHLDHCGYLPKLVHDGFKGRIFCTEATAEIANIVMLDSAKLQEEDVKNKLKRHTKQSRKSPYPLKPLYTVEDATKVAPLFSTTKYRKIVKVGDGIEAEFHDTGHILGAAAVRLKVTQGGESRTIIFSGDVGRWDKPILNDPNPFDQADYLLVESTYGDRTHEDPGSIEDMLAEIINRAVDAKGNIVIPSFAIERSQELLYHLNTLLRSGRIPKLTVYFDSPMAQKVTDVFEHHPELFDNEMLDLIRKRKSPFDFPTLEMARTSEESKAINNAKGSSIIIAGSGMCTGGRIKHHLAHNIARPESVILFVGYQASGTLGRILLNRPQMVRILGQEQTVRARIEQIHGFSGHADRDELIRWISGIKNTPRHIFVTHGETSSAKAFADTLRGKIKTEISVPAYKDFAVLD